MKNKNIPLTLLDYLLESLDVKYTVKRKTKKEFSATLENSHAPITFTAFDTGADDGWHVVFFTGDGRDDSAYELTGKGEQFLVKAFVLKVFAEFIRAYKPDYMTFGAKHDNGKSTRANVYARIIMREIAGKYGYKLESIKSNGETEFYMTKI